MQEARAYSFELNGDMLRLLREEFDVEKVTSAFADAIKGKTPKEIEAGAKAIFEEYGRNWIRRCMQLGEEYPDRTYEVLKAAIDKTGGYYRFGLVPQRLLEIAYLSTHDISTLPIIECTANRLIYRMVDCLLFSKLREKCGDEIVKLLPCRHACLTACQTLHDDLNIDASIGMEASMPKEGYCRFAAKKA